MGLKETAYCTMQNFWDTKNLVILLEVWIWWMIYWQMLVPYWIHSVYLTDDVWLRIFWQIEISLQIFSPAKICIIQYLNHVWEKIPLEETGGPKFSMNILVTLNSSNTLTGSVSRNSKVTTWRFLTQYSYGPVDNICLLSTACNRYTVNGWSNKD